ncbi:ferric reductase-like transmembrane domain-containing protein [Arabiibacter massiliensis]|uniref:ferric reductase-like transmembrane domain-containing protein n=1 Tax=Arabiibacter massiliensis TaxID=1870985 RepID=UPI0009B9DFCB|nr:ferric reductase-like transmembrane domain-containing protein [Arabiibacter massiliensis]
MKLVLVLLGAVAFAFACKRPIKACPLAFYALAIVLDVAFVVGTYVGLPPLVYDILFLTLHKCTLATALFAVVMYIGVFQRDSRVATYLRPIRAELSIIAWLLSLGHMAFYLSSYLTSLSSGLPQTNVAVSLGVALALLALLVVLGVTSFNVVKKRMAKETWKRVQKLAYPFWALVYVHLLLLLLPSALLGGAPAQTGVAVYSVVFLGYAVLRVRRAVIDRHHVPEAALA